MGIWHENSLFREAGHHLILDKLILHDQIGDSEYAVDFFFPTKLLHAVVKETHKHTADLSKMKKALKYCIL